MVPRAGAHALLLLALLNGGASAGKYDAQVEVDVRSADACNEISWKDVTKVRWCC